MTMAYYDVSGVGRKSRMNLRTFAVNYFVKNTEGRPS